MRAQASPQNMQVVGVRRSGAPNHFACRSERVPVGHTSTHDPQKEQPASARLWSKACPTRAWLPRPTKSITARP